MEYKDNKIYKKINVTKSPNTKNYYFHTPNDDDMKKLIVQFNEALKEMKLNTISDIKLLYPRKALDYIKECQWYEMPEYVIDKQITGSPSFIFSYKNGDETVKKLFELLSKKLNTTVSYTNKTAWYPNRLESLYTLKDYVYESPIKNKYPIYIISVGRWKERLTVKYLEWSKIDYKIVVEPSQYNNYAEVIDKSKILTLPEDYSKKNTGSIPARNFVLEHSRKNGDKRHWILDDNIRCYKRMNHSQRTVVKGGVAFRVVEDYVDRYTNIMLSGHNYTMFVVPTSTALKPVTFNSKVYSSILLDNSIPFQWRGRYNEDVDLSLRVLKAGYPTVQFNCIAADKLKTLVSKGGNTDTIYNVKDAHLLKAKSLKDQHPDVVEIGKRFDRIHHKVNYQPFKKNKMIPIPNLKLKNIINEFGMKLVKKPKNFNMDDEEENSDSEENKDIEKNIDIDYMVKTHRISFLKKYNLADKSYSLKELSEISSVPMTILQQVYNRGIGAYKTNPTSVRLKKSFIPNVPAPMSMKLSKEQWAMARVYSFLDNNPKVDNDLRTEIEEKNENKYMEGSARKKKLTKKEIEYYKKALEIYEQSPLDFVELPPTDKQDLVKNWDALGLYIHPALNNVIEGIAIGTASGKPNFALHAVIVHKPYSLEKAQMDAMNIMKSKKPKFMRETTQSYRFRNIPKTKFDRKTFKTQVINPHISLIWGQLM